MQEITLFILRHVKKKSLQRGSFRMSMSAVFSRLQACGDHPCEGTVGKLDKHHLKKLCG